MEVFIAFYSEDQAVPMLDSAQRWAKCKGASPNVIQVPEKGFEIKRRVLADNLAQEEYYILADMLCVPGEKYLIKQIRRAIKENPDINLFGLTEKSATGEEFYLTKGSGVRVCRKGAVEKWPQQITAEYDTEHAQAARKVKVLSDVFYARLSQC